MAFDFKKEYKSLYQPKAQPGIIEVPPLNFIAARGQGDPNQEGSEYKNAIELLYGAAYALKMSYKTDYKIPGFFEYVVPPLEGFWWQEGGAKMDYEKKQKMRFIALLRLPDFIRSEDLRWAKEQAAKKKKRDFSSLEFFTYAEGLCVQCMHIGPYDTEPATTALMHEYAASLGYQPDITAQRYHHEIYLSNPQKCEAAKLKTVLRHPIKKMN